MRDLNSVEEKILDSALYLIGSRGNCDVPIRAIAKEAGVNVSAINYYFRTKEEMLRQTKEFFIKNSVSIYSILDNEEYSEEERLILFSNEIMEYTIRYSALTAIFKEAQRLKDEDEVSRKIVEVTSQLYGKMERILRNVIDCENSELKYNVTIFMSSLIHPIDKNDTLNYDCSLLDGKEKRMEYIKHIITLMKRK